MRTRSLRRFLAVLGAAASLAVTVRVWQAVAGQQAIWPLPGFYLLEMVALSCLAAVLAFRDGRVARLAPWTIVGAIAGFVVVGAWSLGPAYAPALLLLGISAALAPNASGRSILSGLALAAVAGAAQAAIMLSLVRVVDPSASF